MEFYARFSFGVELVLASILFLISEKFRKRLGIYVYFLSIGIFLTIVYFSYFNIKIRNDDPGELDIFLRSLSYIYVLIAMIGAIYASFEISITKALVIGVLSYATQHMSYDLLMFIFNIFNLDIREFYFTWQYFVIFLISYTVVFTFSYFFISKRIRNRDIPLNVRNIKWIIIAIFTTLFIIVLNLVNTYKSYITYIYDLIGTLLCFLICLSMNKNDTLENDNQMLNKILQENKDYYEMAKVNLEEMNIRSHDIKNVLAKMKSNVSNKEYEKELSQLTETYDSLAKTGNEALDTILTQKSIYAKAHNIHFSYICDGKAIAFMNSIDCYTLIGNILNNAFEASLKLDESQRIIRLDIRKKGEFCFLEESNFYNGEITFKNDEIQTSKEDKDHHGFGIKSIKLLSKKYKGTPIFKTENKVFTLSILFPLTQ